MNKEKAMPRVLEKRDGELWFGAKVATVVPTAVPAVVLITTDEPSDAAYDAMHYIKSTEHYVSSSELLQIMTDGRGLTDDQAGALLAELMGTRQALAHFIEACDQARLTPIVTRLRGAEGWSAALNDARSVLERCCACVALAPDGDDLVSEQEHASGTPHECGNLQ